MRSWYSAVHLLHNAYTAWIVLLLSVVMTIGAYFLSSHFVEQRIRDRFAFYSYELEKEIESHLLVYEQVLRSTASFIYASEQLTRPEFAAFVDNLQLDKYWPGIQGIGYSVILPSEQKEMYEAEIRAEGYPDFAIKPADSRPFYTVIQYLEPFDWRNQRAFGYDMYTNEVRREAMNRAWLSGDAATSGKITLVQETDTDRQHGFLTYLPVYNSKTVPETQAQRINELNGWVYAAFRVKDLMNGVTGGEAFAINFSVYSGDQAEEDELLYHGAIKSDLKPLEWLQSESRLILQGHPWTLTFQADPRFLTEVQNRHLPRYVAVGGIVIDILLFYVILSLYFLNRKAEMLAVEKTEQLSTAHGDIKKQKLFANTIVDNLPLVLLVKDVATGLILRTNDYANYLFDDGSEGSKVLFQHFQQRITETFSESTGAGIAQGEDSIEVMTLHGNRWFEVKRITVVDDNNETGFLLYVATDITENVVSENRFHSLFELAPCGLLLVDQGLHIKLANTVIREIFGYDRDDLIGSSTEALIVEFDSEGEYSSLKQLVVQLSQVMPSSKLCKARTKKGKVFSIEISVKSLHYDGEDHWLLALSDVSNHVRLVRQLENASRYKSEFLASMSHELRTPLNSVIGFTARVQKRMANELDQRSLDALNAVSRNAHHLLTLINDILDLSKIEAGHMEVVPEMIDLRQLLEVHLQSLLPMAKTKGLVFRINLTPIPVLMNTDKTLIIRIVNNLVTNAIKYTEQGEICVTLELYQDDQWGEAVRFRVMDTGIGISKQDQTKLFNEFIRLDDAKSHAVEGTGLGLAITSRLVAMLEGRVKVASIYGEGSTFTVEIPILVQENRGSDPLEIPA